MLLSPERKSCDAVITTDSRHILTGVVGPEYSLVMTLDRGAVVGHAIYLFRKAVAVLDKEIY